MRKRLGIIANELETKELWLCRYLIQLIADNTDLVRVGEKESLLLRYHSANIPCFAMCKNVSF